jgi:hypothetical protein
MVNPVQDSQPLPLKDGFSWLNYLEIGGDTTQACEAGILKHPFIMLYFKLLSNHSPFELSPSFRAKSKTGSVTLLRLKTMLSPFELSLINKERLNLEVAEVKLSSFSGLSMTLSWGRGPILSLNRGFFF